MRVSYPPEFSVCLVSFENTGKETEYIPINCWGASGLVAVDTDNEVELRKILRAGFDYLELKIVEIGKVSTINSPEEIEEKDSHLAENIKNWEPGKRWVIGTVHGYYGKGEA